MAGYGTVVGYFPSRATAEAAISALKTAGFQQNQIGVAARSSSAGAAPTSTADYGTTDRTAVAGQHTGQHTEGMWEKIKNFFEGNDSDSDTTAASRETFADRDRTSAAYGSDDVHDSLSGLSVSDEHARYFGQRFEGGTEGAIVTVSAPGREEEAATILEENGGDLGDAAEGYKYEAETPAGKAGDQNIELYGEVLRVHKERIDSGDVRVRKEIRTTTETVEVPVTREELVIDRIPVAGEQIARDATFAGEEIRIPLSEERASVDKQAVLREQVRVGKKEVTDIKSFDAQVRNEDLKVDRDSIDPERDEPQSKVG